MQIDGDFKIETVLHFAVENISCILECIFSAISNVVERVGADVEQGIARVFPSSVVEVLEVVARGEVPWGFNFYHLVHSSAFHEKRKCRSIDRK